MYRSLFDNAGVLPLWTHLILIARLQGGCDYLYFTVGKTEAWEDESFPMAIQLEMAKFGLESRQPDSRVYLPTLRIVQSCISCSIVESLSLALYLAPCR